MTSVLLAIALAAAPSWKSDALSDDAALRAPVLAHLRAKGLPGLYAVQDLVSHAQDAAERARAIRALGELGNPEAEWALRAELKQPSPLVAAAAVRAAAGLRLQQLHALVVARVGDPDGSLCQALGQAVTAFPEIATAARQALSDPNPPRQLAGLRILAAAGDSVSAAEARRLLDAKLPELSLQAAEALAPTDGEAAEPVEAAIAKGPDPLGGRAAQDLAQLGTPAALAALEAMARDGATAARAIGALATSPRGLSALLTLRATDPALAGQVDRALAGRPPATAELLAVVRAADAAAARAAAALLAGRPDGVAALERCVREVGLVAQRCALGLTAPLAAPALARAEDSVDDHVRALAAWALASADKKPSLDALAPLAVDPSAAVRAAAALGLGRLGAEGVPLLRTLVHDRADDVRATAAGQLAEVLPEAELVELVRGTVDDEAVRPRLLPALARLPEASAVSLLLEELRRGTIAERRQALEQLSRFSDPRAYDALMQVASRDPDQDARQLAAKLLGN